MFAVADDVVGAGDVGMRNLDSSNLQFIIGLVSIIAAATPSVAQNFETATAKKLIAPVLNSSQRDAMRGLCRTDLSVESIEMRKSGPNGPTSIRMVVRNVGSEVFSTSPVFAKAVIEVQDGATGATTRHAVGNIVLVRPGESRQSAVTLRRAVFGTFLPPRNNAGEIRASVNFSPNAPRCGIDPNSANDQLVATHEQVRDWLRGSQPNVFLRR